MDVQKLRDEIPVLANATYLNTGWSGPPPLRVAQALKDRIDLELYEGPTSRPVQEQGARPRPRPGRPRPGCSTPTRRTCW